MYVDKINMKILILFYDKYIPHSISYGVHRSQNIRISMISSLLADFNTTGIQLMNIEWNEFSDRF